MSADYSLMPPMLGLMLLTLMVWLVMFIRRIRYMQANRISAEQMKSPSDTNQLIPADVNAPAHQLNNLSELPILFYALCLLLMQQQLVDESQWLLAWGFVLFRTLQAAIHLTVNVVIWRFGAYFLSCLCLWAMLITALLQLY
ncbi:MAPEG family protein [uncultured Ferrimonas sp.]|uniref:MAPEG family protein n=1 Tax=uncultured Ferrimonas sp. TaxID=432640 RepID=UPI00260C8D75|nr:MAPEG family protein [uncultured Ferrimonas sp.]